MDRQIEIAVMFIQYLGNISAVPAAAGELESSFPVFMPELQSGVMPGIRHHLDELKRPFVLHFSDPLEARYTIVGCGDIYLILGPYRSRNLKRIEAAEILEQNRKPDEWTSLLLANYRNLPMKTDADITNICQTFLLAMGGGSEYTEKNVTFSPDEDTDGNEPHHPLSMNTSQKVVAHYDEESTYMNYIRLGDTRMALETERHMHSTEYFQKQASSREDMLTGFSVFRTTTRIAARDAGLMPPVLDSITGFYRDKMISKRTPEEMIEVRREFVRAICTAIQARRNMNYSPVVQQAVDHIRRNLSERISVQSLSEDIGISPNRLSAKFHRETGETITKFITTRRLSAAADLLAMTTLSIQEISDRVGISSSTYFAKLFREHYGISPSRYRDGRVTR